MTCLYVVNAAADAALGMSCGGVLNRAAMSALGMLNVVGGVTNRTLGMNIGSVL